MTDHPDPGMYTVGKDQSHSPRHVHSFYRNHLRAIYSSLACLVLLVSAANYLLLIESTITLPITSLQVSKMILNFEISLGSSLVLTSLAN